MAQKPNSSAIMPSCEDQLLFPPRAGILRRGAFVVPASHATASHRRAARLRAAAFKALCPGASGPGDGHGLTHGRSRGEPRCRRRRRGAKSGGRAEYGGRSGRYGGAQLRRAGGDVARRCAAHRTQSLPIARGGAQRAMALCHGRRRGGGTDAGQRRNDPLYLARSTHLRGGRGGRAALEISHRRLRLVGGGAARIGPGHRRLG
jgi:hypothetical protein